MYTVKYRRPGQSGLKPLAIECGSEPSGGEALYSTYAQARSACEALVFVTFAVQAVVLDRDGRIVHDAWYDSQGFRAIGSV